MLGEHCWKAETMVRGGMRVIIVYNILIETARMEQGSSPELKQMLCQTVDFPQLLLPSNIFYHLDKQHSIPRVSQIKTAIIRILSQRHEWTIFQFLQEIHTRSTQSNFSMKIVLLYATALIIRSIFHNQSSAYDKNLKNLPCFIRLVKGSPFQVASVSLRAPCQNQMQFKEISLISLLLGMGIQVVKKGQGLLQSQAMVRYSNLQLEINMPSQIVFEINCKINKIELVYNYKAKGHPNIDGNYIRLDDFMRLGRHIRCGHLAGLQLQQRQLFQALQSLVERVLQEDAHYFVLQTHHIFIHSNSHNIQLKTSLQPLKHTQNIPANFFQCPYADRSIFIQRMPHSKHADYYSAGIVFLEAIAIKHNIKQFKMDLEKSLGILVRKSFLQESIDFIQERRYFTDREAIGKLRSWLHMDDCLLEHHAYFEYAGQFQEAVVALVSQESRRITSQLESMISNPVELDQVLSQEHFLRDLGFSGANAALLEGQSCPNCQEDLIYKCDCEHKFCLNCYYVSLQQALLMNGLSATHAACPQKDCTAIIPPNIIHQILNTGEDKREFKKKLIRSILSNGSSNIKSYSYCIKDLISQGKEEYFFYQKGNKQLFICQCDESRCTTCLMLFHLPLTCAQFEKQQQHLLKEAERSVQTGSMPDIITKVLKICRELHLDQQSNQIAKIPLLMKEWRRINLCFAMKAPRHHLGSFFSDLASKTQKMLGQLYFGDKQLFTEEKRVLIDQLTNLAGLRSAFLLSTLL